MAGDSRTSSGRSIPILWPPELIRPDGPASLIYLDLNHWINLAKARMGKGIAGYIALLEAARDARAAGQVRFVLSSSFVQEFSAIPNPRQRADIVALIDDLTDFEYLAGLTDIMCLELQAFLDIHTRTRGFDLQPIQLVGASMLHSFGMRGGLKLVETATEVDLTPGVRSDPERSQWFSRLERRAERELLQGPSDEEAVELRLHGYQPERPREGHHNNVLIEQAFANERVDEHWRKGRLLDLLAARHLSLELIDMLTRELLQREITLADVYGRLDRKLDLPLSMPTSSVFVGMKVQYHRDSQHRWTDNDLHDIAAMAVAVPYCDIVFTDAAARNAILSAKLDKQLNTWLPRTPDELAERLRLQLLR